MYEILLKDGIFTISTGAGFLPSTVCVYIASVYVFIEHCCSTLPSFPQVSLFLQCVFFFSTLYLFNHNVIIMFSWMSSKKYLQTKEPAYVSNPPKRFLPPTEQQWQIRLIWTCKRRDRTITLVVKSQHSTWVLYIEHVFLSSNPPKSMFPPIIFSTFHIP